MFGINLRSIIQKRFDGFLKKRMPASSHQQLSNRNIFILPSKFGIAYLLSVLIVFLLGTNYQNNLILLVSYLFISLFFSGMLYSFFNLSRLAFTLTKQVNGFAGQHVTIPLNIITNKPRYDLHFAFTHNKNCHKVFVEQGESLISIPFYSGKRGLHNTGRLRISSEYILGLFTCWTTLDFNCVVTTYPTKKTFNNLNKSSSAKHEEMNGNQVVEGGDDFGELREYRVGESNAQIAWKQLARGQGRLTKTTQQELGSSVWLTLDDLPAAPIETKLEMLCFLILDHHKHGTPFGLMLHSLKIEPSISHHHTQQCLSALAQYQVHSISEISSEHVSRAQTDV